VYILHFRGVIRGDFDLEHGRARFHIFHKRPCFGKIGHILHQKVVQTGVDDQGQSIQHFQGSFPVSGVREGDFAAKSADRLVRYREIGDFGSYAGFLVLFAQTERMGRNVHALTDGVRLIRRRARKGFDHLAAVQFEKCAVADGGGELVGAAGALVLKDRLVLCIRAETGDTLTPVHVEDPHRDTPDIGDAGKKAGEHRGLAVVLDGESPVVLQAIGIGAFVVMHGHFCSFTQVSRSTHAFLRTVK